MPTNLIFRNRSDPTQGQVDSNGDDTDDPEYFAVMHAVISKDNGKDDTTEVSCSACAA